MTQTNTAETRNNDDTKPIGGLSVRVVFNAIRHHPLVFVGVLLFTAAAAAGVWFFLPLPRVTAAVVFRVSSQPESLLSGVDNRYDFSTYKQSQMTLIKSRRTLNAALNVPAVRDLPFIQQAEPDAPTWLEKHLVVNSSNGSEYVHVRLEGDNEGDLRTFLNTLQKVYLEITNERENGSRIRRETQLERIISDAEKEIKQFENYLKGSQPISTPRDFFFSPDEKIRFDEFQKASDELERAEVELKSIDASLAGAKHRLHRVRMAYRRNALMVVVGGAVMAPALFQDDSSANDSSDLLANVNEALRQEPRLREHDEAVESARKTVKKIQDLLVPGATNTALTKAQADLRIAEANRDEFKREARVRLENYVKEKTIESQESLVMKLSLERNRNQEKFDWASKRRKRIQEEIDRFNAQKAELGTIQNRIAQKEKHRAAAVEELERIRAEKGSQPRVELQEEPYLIYGIEGNRKLKYTLLAGLGTFLISFGGLVFWEHRGRRVTRTEEVSAELGMRLIGTIPPIASDSTGTLPNDSHSPLVEAIDTARIMLTHGAPDASRLRVLMVTSAVSGEGKTTLSGNLAISLTRAGFRTLLIDGDMQAPSAHVLFELAEAPGLSELLRGDADFASAIKTSPVPGLSILPAGRWNMSTRQSLVGDRWRMLKKELESRFDFVVIDTSPLLLVSDAMLLAREADGVILSVLLGVSQIARVAETVNRLNAIGAQLAGVVVNNVQSEIYHRYTARTKYAMALPLANDASPSEVSAPGQGEEEPMAEELAAGYGGNQTGVE